MHRTRIVITALLVAVAAASTATLAATAASRGGTPCPPKITTIGGHKAAVNCGPATATLHIGGKTYTFRNGFCQASKSAGAALELNLGTSVIGVKDNAGKADFSMLIAAHLHSAYGSGSVFHAHYGGKSLLGGDSLIKASGAIPAKGTFTSTVTVGAEFNGAWNCHGLVWQAP